VQLGYTNIVSPVDGTIVSRNVDVGQTVASSFQPPPLFLIAKDLTKMQVDTNVSESDIGYIREGQAAAFTVDAFPGRDFAAVIGQVRQAPITVQNVVTYDTVMAFSNPELLLKPGMTANVTIVTARRDDVLRVPIAALSFTPRRAGQDPAAPAAPQRQQVSGAGRVWVLEGGQPRPVAVTVGLDDGSNVEILSGDLKPGDLVITDRVRTAAGVAGGSSPLRMSRF
jgi:HlyD family secretion protein